MAKYVDHSEAAKRAILKRKAPLVTKMAKMVRATIVQGMENATPSGETEGGHTRSAPGERPAIETRDYVNSWKTTNAVIDGDRVSARAYTDLKSEDGETLRGILLEYGTTNMAPRPHVRPALAEIRPKIKEMSRKDKS